MTIRTSHLAAIAAAVVLIMVIVAAWVIGSADAGSIGHERGITVPDTETPAYQGDPSDECSTGGREAPPWCFDITGEGEVYFRGSVDN